MQPGVGIVCPLHIELSAMRMMLGYPQSVQQFDRDASIYHLGPIGNHSVVIAGLPDGHTGIASAASVAERLWARFQSVKALLLVGVGGGVPTTKNDMRLGDVVVSRPAGNNGGVVQYDFGKSLSNGRFERTGALNSPPENLLAVLTLLRSNHDLKYDTPPDYVTYLEASQSNPKFEYPGVDNDLLFEANYEHIGGPDCTNCRKATAMEKKRNPRKAKGPVIHYGTIASANQLMRDAKKRDSCNKDYGDCILCFEMEAAGLANSPGCLVIRGISDYADSHKREDKAWHGYAAAAAAAVAKEFICTIPYNNLQSMPTVAETLAMEG
jgi:nucleoside phosphorylase